jgi:thiol-disulfide isomerase/thioredoxin
VESASRRRHPVVLGSLAAGAAFVAALAVAAVLSSISSDSPARPAEVELRFSGDDRDDVPSLVGDDPTGQAVPTERFSRLEGGFGSFADYRGKPLVVNFFSSTCVPCITEMPDFEAVHQELGDQVAFLGVNFQDQVSDATDLVDETGVTYDIARDPSGELARALGMVVMPSTFFVSPEGRIVDMQAGVLSADELRQRIEELRA